MKLKGNCVVAQSGGPTAVINASAFGVIEEAMKTPAVKGVWSATNGLLGVLDEDFYDLRKEDPVQLRLLRSSPASALGSNRHKIKTDEELKRLLDIMKKFDIRFFFYIGGNDSMDTADKLDRAARESNYEMRVMGVPKTVDNDLFGTDHCPGYGSVIKYLAATTMEVGRDTEAMLTNEPVSIIESMGRNTGWIAAGASLAKRFEDDPPHMILLPEAVFDPGKFADGVRNCLKKFKRCTIVVSEGIKNKSGKYVAEDSSSLAKDSFGHTQLGGAALFIKSLVETEVKVKARFVLPTLAQRSATHFASRTDSDEAYAAGREAVRLAGSGISGRMTVINRISDKPYRSSIGSIDLSRVANGEHFFPKEWITEDGFFVKQEFLDYARPLIQGEVKLTLKDGLPVYTRLRKEKISFNKGDRRPSVAPTTGDSMNHLEKLKAFTRTKDFFIGIDSDGCAFPTMELKHKECFIPNIIKFYGLQSVSKYAREAAEFVNLYSIHRGINRFPALVKAIEFLSERPEVKKSRIKMPDLSAVRRFIGSGKPLSNAGLKEYMKDDKDPQLKRLLDWSENVNRDIEDMVKGVEPFSSVRESLEKISAQADIMVVSATPGAALEKEWTEHGIAKYAALIAGQEMGTKKEHLQIAAKGKYPEGHVLMIGDAPGDHKAAEANGALFFPVKPGDEEGSWELFLKEVADRFFSGKYSGEYQEVLIRDFYSVLPEKPSW